MAPPRSRSLAVQQHEVQSRHSSVVSASSIDTNSSGRFSMPAALRPKALRAAASDWRIFLVWLENFEDLPKFPLGMKQSAVRRR